MCCEKGEGGRLLSGILLGCVYLWSPMLVFTTEVKTGIGMKMIKMIKMPECKSLSF